MATKRRPTLDEKDIHWDGATNWTDLIEEVSRRTGLSKEECYNQIRNYAIRLYQDISNFEYTQYKLYGFGYYQSLYPILREKVEVQDLIPEINEINLARCWAITNSLTTKAEVLYNDLPPVGELPRVPFPCLKRAERAKALGMNEINYKESLVHRGIGKTNTQPPLDMAQFFQRDSHQKVVDQEDREVFDKFG